MYDLGKSKSSDSAIVDAAVHVAKYCFYTATFPALWAKIGYDKLTKKDVPPVDKTLKVATAVFLGVMVASAIEKANAAPVETITAGSIDAKTSDQVASYLKTSFHGNPDSGTALALTPAASNTLRAAPVSVPEYSNTMR